MNTLVLDLQTLIFNHLTSVEDVFINYQNHCEFKNIKLAVRHNSWKCIIYYVQRFEYQKHNMMYICRCAYKVKNDKLVRVFKSRYNLDINVDDNKNLCVLNNDTLKRIDTNWRINKRDIQWLLKYLDFIPDSLVVDLSHENDLGIVSEIMNDYFTRDPTNTEMMVFWIIIQVLAGRNNDFRKTLQFTYQLISDFSGKINARVHHDVTVNVALTASIRVDNLELFSSKYAIDIIPLNEVITESLYFSAFRILNYIFETYDVRYYNHKWTNREISDPRIARILVNQKNLKIDGLNILYSSCVSRNYDVVANILLEIQN